MKKIIAFMLAASLALSLAACGEKEPAEEPVETPYETPEPVEEPVENPFEDMELCAGHAIDQLKSILKNPSSLIVNNMYAVVADDCYIFDIDYSAQNGFGGMNRDDYYIGVNSIENGFTAKFYDTDYFFTKYSKVSGTYVFDPETYQVIALDVGSIDDTIGQRVELVGKMKKERDESIGFAGAWDFELNGSVFLKIVNFVEGTDLSWYKQFTGLPYEITISAIKDEDGVYWDAEIVEDTIRYATYEERLQRFSYHDRSILKATLPNSGIEPMKAEDIQAALADTTFSMRDTDGTYTITFNADGTVDETCISAKDDHTLYEQWRIEDDHVVCAGSRSGFGKTVALERSFTPYQFDEAYLLLEDTTGAYSISLTQK